MIRHLYPMVLFFTGAFFYTNVKPEVNQNIDFGTIDGLLELETQTQQMLSIDSFIGMGIALALMISPLVIYIQRMFRG